LCYPAGINFIDLKALTGSGRQCGVVVFAADIVHGFTMPDNIGVGIAMIFAGAVVIFVNSIKWRNAS